MEPWVEWLAAARCRELTHEQRQLAFGQLVARFQAEIYARALRSLGDVGLAQDVTQETFLTAYQQLDQLRAAPAFPRWLQQILRTHCNRVFRKPALPTSPLEACHELSDGNLDPAQMLVADDLRETVMAAIAALPQHERTIVHLFYLQGFSLQEIAEWLKLPTTTVKKRLQYARGRLRQRISARQSAGIVCWQEASDHLSAYLAVLLVALVATLTFPPLTPCPALATRSRRGGYPQAYREPR